MNETTFEYFDRSKHWDSYTSRLLCLGAKLLFLPFFFTHSVRHSGFRFFFYFGIWPENDTAMYRNSYSKVCGLVFGISSRFLLFKNCNFVIFRRFFCMTFFTYFFVFFVCLCVSLSFSLFVDWFSCFRC